MNDFGVPEMPKIPVLVIAVFFLLGGIAHFVFLESFVGAMPAYLGFHRELVVISGVFEILGAVGILFARTRRLAAYGLIALSIVVFPANINMAMHPEQFSHIPQVLLVLRLPLQFLFIWFIWWATAPKASKVQGSPPV
jgi:uncharacterized membrane protein